MWVDDKLVDEGYMSIDMILIHKMHCFSSSKKGLSGDSKLSGYCLTSAKNCKDQTHSFQFEGR